jgi:dTDP-4-dehydrorhamnose reductase
MPGWWRRDVRFLPGDPACQGRQPRGEVQRQFPAEKCTEKLPPPLLITGATGTLGQAFARLCELRGLPYKLLARAEMDVADAVSVRHVLSTLKPWAVINTAGYVRVDDAELEHEQCFRENALGPENLARACGEAAVQLVTFSSDLVFNGRKTAPYIESDAVAPLNVYGASKAAAENAVSAALPTALIIRTSAFFGPWDQWNFVTQTLQKLLAGEPVTAAEDLVVTPTYVPELVHTALDLLIDGGSGIWHLANQEPVSWADLAREVARLGNCDESLIRGCPAEELHFKAERPAYTALSSERGKLLSPWYHALRVYFREPAVMQRMANAPQTRPAEFASLASS